MRLWNLSIGPGTEAYTLSQPWLFVRSPERPLTPPERKVGVERKRCRPGARHIHDGLVKGWGFPALPGKPRLPESVRPLANSRAGGDLHKAALCCQDTWTEWGWSRQGGKRGLQVLHCSPGRVSAGPASRPLSRCPDP